MNPDACPNCGGTNLPHHASLVVVETRCADCGHTERD